MKRTGFCRNIIKYTRLYRQGLFYVAINIRQTSATRERPDSNARYGVADGDGGQTFATIVFVYYFISMAYMLNGRKVKL